MVLYVRLKVKHVYTYTGIVYYTSTVNMHFIYIYRIASNKRPTSRKRLPLINVFFLILFYKCPLFKGKECVRNEEKKLLFFYYLQKYRNGCNAVFRIRRRQRNHLR